MTDVCNAWKAKTFSPAFSPSVRALAAATILEIDFCLNYILFLYQFSLVISCIIPFLSTMSSERELETGLLSNSHTCVLTSYAPSHPRTSLCAALPRLAQVYETIFLVELLRAPVEIIRSCQPSTSVRAPLACSPIQVSGPQLRVIMKTTRSSWWYWDECHLPDLWACVRRRGHWTPCILCVLNRIRSMWLHLAGKGRMGEKED